MSQHDVSIADPVPVALGFTAPEQARRRRLREIDNQFGLGIAMVPVFWPWLFIMFMCSMAIVPADPGIVGFVVLILFPALFVAGALALRAGERREQRKTAALSVSLEDLAAAMPEGTQRAEIESTAEMVAGLGLPAARQACIQTLGVLDEAAARGDLDARSRRGLRRFKHACTSSIMRWRKGAF